MVIDTSALLAILENEAAAPALRVALAADKTRIISTMSVLEATCVLSSRRGPAAVLDLSLFLTEFQIEQIPFDAAQLAVAQTAWLHYGRGRHAAQLNFGDCAPYALSRTRNEPLLCIGNDFARTDVSTVVYSG